MPSSYRSVVGRNIQRSGPLTIPPSRKLHGLHPWNFNLRVARSYWHFRQPPFSYSPSRSSVHLKMSMRTGSSESTSTSGKSQKTAFPPVERRQSRFRWEHVLTIHNALEGCDVKRGEANRRQSPASMLGTTPSSDSRPSTATSSEES